MRAAVLSLVLVAATPVAAFAQTPEPTPSHRPVPAVAGTILVDGRLRYEAVSQAGLDDATALTARLRLGWRSPTVANLTLLVEGEAVQAVVGDYNDTIHGPAGRAVVADPEGIELNRLQLSWTGLPDTEVTVGRQRIVLGNARFVGNVGFRQNEQTFDAVRVTTTAFDPVSITYAYLDRVHRVFGDDSPVGTWRSDSHLLYAESPIPIGRLSLYGYWLDLPSAPGQSSATTGARLTGAHSLQSDWSVNWAVEYARQTDYGSSPAQFDLDYRLLSLGLTHGPVVFSVAQERLEGDGTRGFQTPLATLHAFQGWADAFLTTPASGLTDDYLTAGYTFASPPIGRQLAVSAAWHTFSDGRADVDFGREWDVSVRLTIDDHWALETKTALFDGRGPFADRDKIWLALEYRF